MEYFNNKEYFDSEHSKFKQEMLEIGYVQEDYMWVRKDKKKAETRGRISEYLVEINKEV